MKWRRGAANRNRPAANALDPDQWIDVAGVSELRHNRTVVDVGGVAVLVVQASGRYFAMENKCPHLARPLSDGRVHGHVIECASHSYRWNLETGEPAPCAHGLGPRALRRFEVAVTGGRIMLARRDLSS